MEDISRWIIVSNRLPFTYDPATGSIVRSSGGLVTAIGGIKTATKRIWCGIAPAGLDESRISSLSSDSASDFLPVFVEDDLYGPYYNGFSNSVLWPLLHYEIQNVKLEKADWEAYQQVNRIIAEKLAEGAKAGDLVWVHDFHLMLVPGMLRQLRPDLMIGFFLHVPFPSSEIWRQLPMRSDLLHGLLGADLIGFHDFSYLRHFSSAVELLEGITSDGYLVRSKAGIATTGVFPVSIDTEAFRLAAQSSEVEKLCEELSANNSYEHTILGIDRLDYTKGIDLKLKAFEKFLETYPDYNGKVRLLQVAVPTREKVDDYRDLRSSIEEHVANINGRFGTLSHAPLRYLYTSLSENELLALYRMSDILLVSSKRDGMNLVCQEYIACQDNSDPGVVILSEFAGAISNLSHVIFVNPWDAEGTAAAIAQAISLPLKERIHRHTSMLKYLEEYTATAWAEFFMEELRSCNKWRESDGSAGPARLNPRQLDRIKEEISKPELFLFLDFDGTLAPIESHPDLVQMSDETKNILKQLNELSHVNLIVVSGRKKEDLENRFFPLKIPMASEHGAELFDPKTESWATLVRSDVNSWYEQAEKLLNLHVVRVPGSYIEAKSYSLAWHYRQAPKHYGEFQARRLAFELRSVFKELPVSVIHGKKVIEVRSFEADKGLFLRRYMERVKFDPANHSAIVMGDDSTDEDMFRSFNNVCTIKIGIGPTAANYYLVGQEEVAPFLEELLAQRRAG